VHFVGARNLDKNSIYLTNLSKPLYYSGKVKLLGDNQLPSTFIETSYINNSLNELKVEGKNSISEPQLPEINSDFKKIFLGIKSEKVMLKDLEKTKDSLYYNSFLNTTKEVILNQNLSNIIFKGNFILRSEDSIRIKKNT